MLAAFPVTLDRDALVFGLIPRVHTSLIVEPRLHLRRIVGENGKRGHTIIPIVFILVVAPDHTEIGLEFIQLPARPAKAFDHVAAMRVGMSLALVGSPLPAHGSGRLSTERRCSGRAGSAKHILMRRLKFPWIERPG